MSENNRYFYDCGKDDKDSCDYGYENKNCPKKEDKCCNQKEDKCCPKKEDKCCDKKEDKYCSPSKPYEKKKEAQCCCKLGIKRATEILGKQGIKEYINFTAAAFITDFFIVGTELAPLGVNDNLGALTGSLDKLNPCECDLLQISGPLAYPEVIDPALLAELTDILGLTTPIVTTLTALETTVTAALALLQPIIAAINTLVPGLGTILNDVVGSLLGLVTATTDLVSDVVVGLINTLISLFANEASVGANADLASLCAIKAMALEVVGTTPALQVANYDLIKEAIRCFKCEKEDCKPNCDDCCCSSGIINEVASGNLTGTTSLTVGSLVLDNVEVLGCIENALVLGAPYIPAAGTTPAVNAKIYIVCAEAVQFII